MSIRLTDDVPQYRVQSAYDALRLLDIVVSADAPMNATEIAGLVGENRNRVFRLLKTLEEAGYVFQDAASRVYRPTLKLASMGFLVSRSTGLDTVVLPAMEELRRRTGETVYLVGRDGYEAVALVNLESNHLNRISARPGHRWLLGYGAAGQALLFTLPPHVQQEFLEQHPRILDRIEQASERFSRDGVTFVDGRLDDIHDAGVMAIAVPIDAYTAGQRLALAVAWPVARSYASYDDFRTLLLDSAAEIGRGLGGRIGGRSLNATTSEGEHEAGGG